jgi:hypothetical protein
MERLVRNLKQLPEVLRNPRRRRQKLIALSTLASQKFTKYCLNGDGIAVMEQEWDNLLILDASRYDLFATHHDFPGTLSKVSSRGSQSREFLERNFAGQQYHDTVYISGNPFMMFLDDDVFHATVNLFDDQWDDELLTVRPETVVEETLRAHREYPNKRLISHFMQPHYPFIGPVGQRIDSGGVTGQMLGTDAKTRDHTPSIWSRLDLGEVTVDSETVWEAYVENFELVCEHATELVAALDGKSVITSDHGNLFGERLWPIPMRRFGHPPGVRPPALVDVPWHELPFDGRRDVMSEPPVERKSVATGVVEQRLEDLGYV